MRQPRRRLDLRHIGACVGLGDGQRAPLLAHQHVRHNALAEIIAAELDDHWQPNADTRDQAVAQTVHAQAPQLL